MAKIYVSPETLKKLSEKGGYNEILNHFDVNRPEPKRAIKNNNKKPQIIKQRSNNTESEKELRRSLKLLKRKLRKIRQHHHIDIQNLNNPPKKKKKSTTRPLMGDITERRLPKDINQPVTFSYAPRKSSSKPTSSKSSGKKTPVSSKYMFDYSSPVSEYESRQVEFGHGRAKSKEWNDEVARKFQKELKGYHRKKDWTDRFALK